MKRLFLILFALAFFGAGATAQTFDLGTFQTTFETFAGDMASVLAVNSTVGNTWSSAYVGGFPRFGVGLAVGADFVPADSLTPIMALTGGALPAGLDSLGVPIPAAAASFKIGLPFLLMDAGVKAGIIPDAAKDILSGAGVSATYETMGVNLRYALLKDMLVVPAVSLGASWNYLKGSVAAGMGMGNQTVTYSVPAGDDFTITVADPDLALEWEANTFDFTLQVSKSLLIFTPYVGAGYTIGKASVSGGLAAATTVYNDTQVRAANASEIAAIESAAGISLDDQGFLVSAESTDPTLRVYGGMSLNILVLKLDFMASYVPATEALGGQVMVRIQL